MLVVLSDLIEATDAQIHFSKTLLFQSFKEEASISEGEKITLLFLSLKLQD